MLAAVLQMENGRNASTSLYQVPLKGFSGHYNPDQNEL